jgi:hypothetical protein
MSVNAKLIDSKGRAKSGLQAAKTKLKLKGLACIDRRTLNAQRLLGFKASLAAALGGADNLSPQLECLIELIVRTQALIDHADAFLLSQPRLIHYRKRSFYPIVLQRQQLVDSQSRLLGQVGLQRVAAPVQDLREYILERDRAAEEAAASGKAAEAGESKTEETHD